MTSPTPASAHVRPMRQDAALVGLIGMAHGVSHFSQLLLAPLFPWLKTAFDVSYRELGLLMTIFFVVSCTVQAVSGFIVDRVGPRPVLFGGLGLLGLSAFGYAASPSYTRSTTPSSIGRSMPRGSAMPSVPTASPAASAGRSRRSSSCPWRSRFPGGSR
jgi:MFS family permease